MTQAPVGWKLVPAEPTEAMIEAGKDERMKCFADTHEGVGEALTRIFRALLAAAPLPASPAAPVGAVGQAPSIAQAIRTLEKCRDEYMTEYGSVDPDTGTMEYGRGSHGEEREAYVGELSEVIDRLVALENAS